MKTSILDTALLSLIMSIGVAQNPTINPCATYQVQEYFSKTIPDYKQQLDAVNAKTTSEFTAYKQALMAKRTGSVSVMYTFTIPVVFHILHTNGPENVSDLLCISALDQVNRDYGRKGPDTTSIDPMYEPLYVNSHMKFVLAKKDPVGNCTNGIVHHYNVNTQWRQGQIYNYIYSTVGTFNWSPSHYLNIYIVDNIIPPNGLVDPNSTIVGYTTLPGTAPNIGSDAIVYNRNFLSGLQARSLSHEIGHWFGLSHTFGATNSAAKNCGDDDINDTPPTAGFFSTCPSYQTLNDSCDPGHRPNMQNFMDYSGCPLMFTQGQTDKMRFSAQSNTANRNYLVDTANLVFTGIYNKNIVTITPNSITGQQDTTFSYAVAPTTICAPVADFYAAKAKVCQGQVMVYNSTSFNNTTGLTYSWQFDGGSPATSNLATPSVIYSIPGKYSTTLTVTNAAGTSTKVRNSFANVSWHTDQAAYPTQEGFEASASTGVFPAGWSVVNPDYNTLTWQYANYGSNSGKCVVLPNANGGNSGPSDVDILETNQYNFSNTSNITISYDYSYARKPEAKAGDTFAFEYSLDCGGTWTSLGATPTSTLMASISGGTLTSPYIPYSQSKWVTQTYNSVSLGILNNKADVKFRFWFKNSSSGVTQNLYIDNFNITGTVGLEQLENTIGLTIYPNPTSSSSIIEFNSTVNAKVVITVIDLIGQVVEENNLSAEAGNLTRYNVNKNAVLKSGIYFITLDLNDQKITKKLIVE